MRWRWTNTGPVDLSSPIVGEVSSVVERSETEGDVPRMPLPPPARWRAPPPPRRGRKVMRGFAVTSITPPIGPVDLSSPGMGDVPAKRAEGDVRDFAVTPVIPY